MTFKSAFSRHAEAMARRLFSVYLFLDDEPIPGRVLASEYGREVCLALWQLGIALPPERQTELVDLLLYEPFLTEGRLAAFIKRRAAQGSSPG